MNYKIRKCNAFPLNITQFFLLFIALNKTLGKNFKIISKNLLEKKNTTVIIFKYSKFYCNSKKLL